MTCPEWPARIIRFTPRYTGMLKGLEPGQLVETLHTPGEEKTMAERITTRWEERSGE